MKTTKHHTDGKEKVVKGYEISPLITFIIGLSVFIGSLIINYNIEGNKFILFAVIGFIMASFGFIKFIFHKRNQEIKKRLEELGDPMKDAEEFNKTIQSNPLRNGSKTPEHSTQAHVKNQSHDFQTQSNFQPSHAAAPPNYNQPPNTPPGGSVQSQHNDANRKSDYQSHHTKQKTSSNHSVPYHAAAKKNTLPSQSQDYSYNLNVRARPYCPGCGNHTRTHDNFCSYCGSRLK
jgi:hypothetical protein